MQTIPLTEAKDQLSRLVDLVSREHEEILITRHGRTAAVLMSQDELESMRETLFWALQPGIHEDIAEMRRESEEGGGYTADEVRAILDRRDR